MSPASQLCPSCGAVVEVVPCPFCGAGESSAPTTHTPIGSGTPSIAADSAQPAPAQVTRTITTGRVALAGVTGIAVIAVWFAISAMTAASPDPDDDVAQAPTQTPVVEVETEPEPEPEPEPTPELSGEMLNVMEATLISEYGYPAPADDVATVMASADGRACENYGTADDFGGYPVAWCKTWKPAVGLTSGAPLSPGELFISCQSNLGVINPVYTANQENTWWFWARSDRGTWDWFPETALSQGATMQPTNGIAVCR